METPATRVARQDSQEALNRQAISFLVASVVYSCGMICVIYGFNAIGAILILAGTALCFIGT